MGAVRETEDDGQPRLREINEKHGLEWVERNAMRWLVFPWQRNCSATTITAKLATRISNTCANCYRSMATKPKMICTPTTCDPCSRSRLSTKVDRMPRQLVAFLPVHAIPDARSDVHRASGVCLEWRTRPPRGALLPLMKSERAPDDWLCRSSGMVLGSRRADPSSPVSVMMASRSRCRSPKCSAIDSSVESRRINRKC
ncbi:hypothetical protein ABIB68_007339 [Bradyrhizobium sp. F1.2.2]